MLRPRYPDPVNSTPSEHPAPPAHGPSSDASGARPVEPPKGRAIVVGASSGIGAALVRRLSAEGWNVAALARRTDQLEGLAAECSAAAPDAPPIVTLEHDVQDTAAVPALFEQLARRLGGVDLVIYAAGIMSKIERHEYDTAKDLLLTRINFEGCIAWCNEAANLMRTQRHGTIVGISSIAGDRGRKGNPVYGASKAAMDHYLEALRNRLADAGVHVCTIKPGFVATAMTEGMEGLFWVITPDEAARTILRAVRRRANVRYVPWRWSCVGLVIRSIPSFIFKRLNV